MLRQRVRCVVLLLCFRHPGAATCRTPCPKIPCIEFVALHMPFLLSFFFFFCGIDASLNGGVIRRTNAPCACRVNKRINKRVETRLRCAEEAGNLRASPPVARRCITCHTSSRQWSFPTSNLRPNPAVVVRGTDDRFLRRQSPGG